MALDFKNTKGKAIKNSVEAYAYTEGDNKVRIFGGILPRYLYWIKGTNNKDIPIECLSFNRVKEKFDNGEIDHVPSFYPDKKCQWAYSVNCIDPKDGKEKVLNLKKKLWESIMMTAEDLGDPTDPDTGWDIMFKRTKTGPANYNVEYTLQVLKCKKRSLTPEEREVIANAKSIDSKYPRHTPEEIKALLVKLTTELVDENTSQTPSEKEAASDLS